jgi:hypothetical protein
MFPHIIQKFQIDDKCDGNGAYKKLVKNPKWLHVTAIEDVHMLHGCRTGPMFHKKAELVQASWREVGKHDLANTFEQSYVKDEFFNKWFNCVLHIPGCIPQNNSQERTNLEMKGMHHHSGIISAGKNITRMLNAEFPKLIYVHSFQARLSQLSSTCP